jgi:Glycine zipper 2TM domain
VNRPIFALVTCGVSAVVLSGCGRTPTEPSLALSSVQAAETTAADAAVASTAQADLEARERELAAREAELRAQQEELRRQREELEAQSARQFEAGAPTQASMRSPTSSVQKVPTPPIVVPVGTTLSIELAATVNTKTARVGDRVEGRLASDLVMDERPAAMAGAAVRGSVTELVSGSDKIGGVPTIGLTFDSLQAVNGATIPILARYRKQGDSDVGEDAAKVVGGAAAGAAIGHEVGDDDRDTVIGGVIGGVAGAAAAQKTGGDVKIAAGKVITAATETSFSIY